MQRYPVVWPPAASSARIAIAASSRLRQKSALIGVGLPRWMIFSRIIEAGSLSPIATNLRSSSPGHTLDRRVPLPETAERLRLSIARLARLLRQQDDSGLGPTVTAALSSIATHGPLTLGDLAARERVAPPTITKVVEKMVLA